MNSKKILITGGAGFIGSNLARHLLDQKNKVTVIDNLLTGSMQNIAPFESNRNFIFHKIDLIHDVLPISLFSSPFDIVYHLASPASPIQYTAYSIETLLVNSYGTYKLLDFFKKTKSNKFIFTSTSEVYGDPLVHPQPESYWGNVNSVGMRSCYDEGKRAGESLCMNFFRKYDADIRIARIFNTYGPNMEKNDGRVVANLVTQALSGKPLTVYGDGKQTRCFCYVDDMVNALIALSNGSLAGEIINLGSDHEIQMNEIALLIKKLTHTTAPIVHRPLPPDDPKKRKPVLTKAKKLLNWQAQTPLKKGLENTIAYFQKRFTL